MAQSAEYFVHNLSLRVSEKGLVVHVHEMKKDPPRYDKVTDLPDWVFRSALAIWFKEGETSMYHCALAGEKIKTNLMLDLPNIKTKPSFIYKQ